MITSACVPLDTRRPLTYPLIMDATRAAEQRARRVAEIVSRAQVALADADFTLARLSRDMRSDEAVRHQVAEN